MLVYEARGNVIDAEEIGSSLVLISLCAVALQLTL
jgi:hypothetical protein